MSYEIVPNRNVWQRKNYRVDWNSLMKAWWFCDAAWGFQFFLYLRFMKKSSEMVWDWVQVIFICPKLYHASCSSSLFLNSLVGLFTLLLCHWPPNSRAHESRSKEEMHLWFFIFRGVTDACPAALLPPFTYVELFILLQMDSTTCPSWLKTFSKYQLIRGLGVHWG